MKQKLVICHCDLCGKKVAESKLCEAKVLFKLNNDKEREYNIDVCEDCMQFEFANAIQKNNDIYDTKESFQNTNEEKSIKHALFKIIDKWNRKNKIE